MNAIAAAAILLSILDVPGKPNLVVVMACPETASKVEDCAKVVVKRDVLTDDAALDDIAKILKSQLEAR